MVMCTEGNGIDSCYIFSDCKSAIDIVCYQNNAQRYLEDFTRIWRCMDELEEKGVNLRAAWVPGHAGI